MGFVLDQRRSGRARSDELLRGEELGELAPPSPSSVTIVPCVRGGRAVTVSTTVHAAARPTSSALTPRSASDHVSTGFFFAAMIPLNDG